MRGVQMNKVAVVGLWVVVFFVSGCGDRNQFQPPPPPTVTVQHPMVQDVTTYRSYAGRVEASDAVDIYARVQGFLQSCDFKDGERVQKGQQLFSIEPEAYAAEVDSAKAQRAQAEATARMKKAAYERKRKAFQTQAVSELDMLVSEAEMQAADAAVLAAQSALKRAELNFSYTQVKAPLAGRMTMSEMSVGSLVGATGSRLLARLVVESPVNVYFDVDERSVLPFLHGGTTNGGTGANFPKVELELADGALHSEQGTVDYINPEIDPGTGTLRLRAVFANDSVSLLPGLFVKVRVPKIVVNAILIPEVAVLRDMTGSFVFCVNAEDVVESRPVTTGVRTDRLRIIIDGLTAEDRVVVKGVQRVRPGLSVTAFDANGSEE